MDVEEEDQAEDQAQDQAEGQAQDQAEGQVEDQAQDQAEGQHPKIIWLNTTDFTHFFIINFQEKEKSAKNVSNKEHKWEANFVNMTQNRYNKYVEKKEVIQKSVKKTTKKQKIDADKQYMKPV